jgi:hypothetical protein
MAEQDLAADGSTHVYTNLLGLQTQSVVARRMFPHNGYLGLLSNSRGNASYLSVSLYLSLSLSLSILF